MFRGQWAPMYLCVVCDVVDADCVGVGALMTDVGGNKVMNDADNVAIGDVID